MKKKNKKNNSNRETFVGYYSRITKTKREKEESIRNKYRNMRGYEY